MVQQLNEIQQMKVSGNVVTKNLLKNKIEQNIKQDKEVNEELDKQGWIILRF